MSAGIKSNSSGNLELYSGSTKILTADSTTGVATFTSNIIATAPTPTPSSNNTQLATTAYVDGKMVLRTSVASTSGTSIDFTEIPSWVKRITIMFNGVSTNGSDTPIIQIGSGSITTSGYSCGVGYIGANNTSNAGNVSTGFQISSGDASHTIHGHMSITLISNKTYVSSYVVGLSDSAYVLFGGGSITLSSVLDRVRLTTKNGSDTFDAGSVNIMYEG
jgi:hypothetical protein